MDDQAFQILMKMIDDHKKDTGESFKGINKKLDEVLAFRYMLLGGSIVISVIINIFIGFIKG